MTIKCVTCGRELESVNKPHDERDHTLQTVIDLLTSMQENWREQALFDIYNLIKYGMQPESLK